MIFCVNAGQYERTIHRTREVYMEAAAENNPIYSF